jgi:predicted MFS family arabinose efflux permease
MKRFSPLTFYVLAAVSQTSGSSGAAMLGPFFMKAHGYSIALAGIPLVANGIGRVCSDLFSGVMATYLSPGALLIAATAIGIMTSVAGYVFLHRMPVFVAAWIVFGLTSAKDACRVKWLPLWGSVSRSGRCSEVGSEIGSAPTAFFSFMPCRNRSHSF